MTRKIIQVVFGLYGDVKQSMGENPNTDAKFFYKDIIDNLYDGVYFVDTQRTITYWNKELRVTLPVR